MANVFKKIAGTITGYFKIGKTIKVVNNSSVAEFRDYNDSLIRVKAAAATEADDLVTQQDAINIANSSAPVFRADGRLRAISGLDPFQVLEAFSIASVELLRQHAGITGTTTVDINKNGTTIFTTQANRPSVASTDGDNATDSAVPDIVSFVASDIITLDIDAVETNAETLIVQFVRV